MPLYQYRREQRVDFEADDDDHARRLIETFDLTSPADESDDQGELELLDDGGDPSPVEEPSAPRQLPEHQLEKDRVMRAFVFAGIEEPSLPDHSGDWVILYKHRHGMDIFPTNSEEDALATAAVLVSDWRHEFTIDEGISNEDCVERWWELTGGNEDLEIRQVTKRTAKAEPAPPPPGIEPMFVVWTGHISPETRWKLELGWWFSQMPRYERRLIEQSGWMGRRHLPDHHPNTGPLVSVGALLFPSFCRPEGFVLHVDDDPSLWADEPDLQAVFVAAKAAGCCWILFDVDGFQHEGLQRWES